VFGGPLYTLLKAVTAIQLARRLEREGVRTVPVFWVDEEDHDWDEIRSAEILDADLTPRRVTLPDVPGAREHMVSRLTLNGGTDAAIADLETLLPSSDFTSELIGQVRQHYRSGVGVSDAFASWIDALLGRHGLVVFQAADVAAKPLVSDVFVRELQQPGRTAALARAAGAEMLRLGHQPQVEPSEDSVAVFLVDEDGRHPIKVRGAELVSRDTSYSRDALIEQARSSPERFSPNVLLRPLVQDRLFPTVCYVAGPSELAYQAQIKQVYAEFGVAVPLLYSRATATLLDSGGVRFLERHRLALEVLHAQDDTNLNRLLESQLPPTIERALEEAGADIVRRTSALKQDVAALDPTLAGAVDSTADHMQHALKTLHHKIIQAAKRKDETLRRQFDRTRHLAFPGGHPQERSLNVLFALNRYGPGVVDRLIDALPLDQGKHYVLTL
jgi:bacillithiol biosynthesis cysteine-adding enzyme BshC